jgi:metal-sulfur cluster biosynthetic enzyme
MSETQTAPTEEHVLEALKVVVDPELGISIVDLGLVYDVEIVEEQAKITYSLTSMGCPVGPIIDQQIQQVVSMLPGIDIVETNVTFDPPWSPERMTEDAKLALGML